MTKAYKREIIMDVDEPTRRVIFLYLNGNINTIELRKELRQKGHQSAINFTMAVVRNWYQKGILKGTEKR